MSSIHLFGYADAATRPWALHSLPKSVFTEGDKSIATVSQRALWRFSVPDHPRVT